MDIGGITVTATIMAPNDKLMTMGTVKDANMVTLTAEEDTTLNTGTIGVIKTVSAETVELMMRFAKGTGVDMKPDTMVEDKE
jgi:hypothetical protein